MLVVCLPALGTSECEPVHPQITLPYYVGNIVISIFISQDKTSKPDINPSCIKDKDKVKFNNPRLTIQLDSDPAHVLLMLEYIVQVLFG